MAYLCPGLTLNDQFLMIRPLGEGASGLTWHVFDLEEKRNLAVKFLKTAKPSPEAERAFIEEEERVRSLTSPYIVKSFGYQPAVGSNGAGLICFEYLEGAMTLFEACTGLMAGRENNEVTALLGILTLFAQAAEGLGAIHSVGVVHRDIKPENVVVDLRMRARLIDFGLALAGHSKHSWERHGTRSFTAPEVGAKPAGPRSDVYSLGLSLYVCLTGELPVLNLPIPLVDELRVKFPDVPAEILEELDGVFVTSVQRDPELRYRDGTEMARALGAVNEKLRQLRLDPKKVKHAVRDIKGGHVRDLRAVVDSFIQLAADLEITRLPYYRLDGLLLTVADDAKHEFSNRTPAFVFMYKGVQYQINSDTMRKAMYRLVDAAERVRQQNGDFDQLVVSTSTKDGVRTLRLASYLPDSEGALAANGFYCYAADDMARLGALG
jgi:serine/threonine protein kinase